MKIANNDTGKLQTMKKCLHNGSKGLLGSRAVTNFLPLRTTGKLGKNDKIIANGLGLSKKYGLDSLPIMGYFITQLGTNNRCHYIHGKYILRLTALTGSD